jgi:hypothetical protein
MSESENSLREQIEYQMAEMVHTDSFQDERLFIRSPIQDLIISGGHIEHIREDCGFREDVDGDPEQRVLNLKSKKGNSSTGVLHLGTYTKHFTLIVMSWQYRSES